MRKLVRGVLAVAEGEATVFSDFADGGDMWTGAGERSVSREVRFEGSFLDPPVVKVWVSMWDVSKDANMRLDLRAENVRQDGFLAVVRTWGDSRIARLRVAWVAIGTVVDDDHWEVD